MIYTLDGELHLSDLPTPLLHQLIRELTVPNPRYENALRLGRPAWNIPKTIMLYEIKGNALTLPRGMAEEVWRQRPAGTVSKDRTLRGEPCPFEKAGFTLRDYQKQAVDAALACKWCQGVLVAPCGAGKTEALVLDIVDEKTPQLLTQYKQRRSLYKKMNITEKE